MNISRKAGHFATSESQVAIFVPEISPKIQKCRNPKINFFENRKSPYTGPKRLTQINEAVQCKTDFNITRERKELPEIHGCQNDWIF